MIFAPDCFCRSPVDSIVRGGPEAGKPTQPQLMGAPGPWLLLGTWEATALNQSGAGHDQSPQTPIAPGVILASHQIAIPLRSPSKALLRNCLESFDSRRTQGRAGARPAM